MRNKSYFEKRIKGIYYFRYLGAFILLFLPTLTFSSTYHILWDIIDEGSGKSISNTYKIKDSVGQVVVGTSESEKYKINTGATRNYTYTQTFITSPAPGDSITGKVNILGTANSNYFRSYLLSYRPDNPNYSTDWRLLNTSSSAVIDSLLGSWDTNNLSGRYNLRLYLDDHTYSGKENVVPVIIKNTTTQKISLPAAEWRMVSFPLIAKERKPENFFPSLSDLKVYYWEEKAEMNEYQKYRTPYEILPGRAYWVKLSRSGEYQFSGDLIDQTKDFNLPINSGWNQIANPFIFNINWEESKLKYNNKIYDLETAISSGYIDSYIYWYEKGGYLYNSEGALEPMRGFWIYSYVPAELILSPFVTLSDTGLHTKNKPYVPSAASDKEWYVQISASCSKYQDLYNFVGVVNSSTPSALEPPVIGEYVSLYFRSQSSEDKEQKKVTNDFRNSSSSTFNSQLIWDMVIETNLLNTDTTLSWKEITPVPSDIDLILYDKLAHKVIDMKNTNNYTFSSGPRGKKEFEIRAGKFQTGPITLTEVSNYPNPTSGNTTFVYKYTGTPVRVQIEIYNIAGKLIRTLEDTTINGTFNTPVNFLANGVYIYRIIITDEKGNKKSLTNKLVVVK